MNGRTPGARQGHFALEQEKAPLPSGEGFGVREE